MRVLLHPGFHKTGTSSMQRGAMARMPRLARHLRFLNNDDLARATRAARRYSQTRDPQDLHRFAEAFDLCLDAVSPDDPRALLISSEDLSGYMPGHHGVITYDAAAPLMNVATATLAARFGTDAGIIVWFTTRAPAAWARSAYYQILRAHRVTDSYESYHPVLAGASHLQEIVDEVAARVQGRARVVTSAIEEIGPKPLGPLGEALALLGIPATGLAPLPAQNVQPEGAIDALLALNRSDLDDDALAEAKRRLIRTYRQQGETRRAPARKHDR